MNLEIALGLLASCAVALIFMQRSLGLFRRHVWVLTDGRIVDASLSESGSMSIEVRYLAGPGPGAPRTDRNREFTNRFNRHESVMEKFGDRDERIAAVVGLDVGVWYAQAEPKESYLDEPVYFFLILKGIAGFVFGAALLGFTIYLVKVGPDSVMNFMRWN